MSASVAQIGAIHAMAKRAGLDEGARRDFLEAKTGKRSSRDLDGQEAGRVIEALKEIVPPAHGSTRPASRTVSGRWAGVLRALWLSGWNLGVVANRRDEALIAFVERQTGIAHPRWMLDPADARRAIEGLKKWLERAAGVDWTICECRKRAVIFAQLRILHARGAGLDEVPPGDAAGDVQLDAMIVRLGKMIRSGRPA